MNSTDPESEPKTHEATRKGHVVPPDQPELKQAPLHEPYGKKSGSKPAHVPEERSSGATPADHGPARRQ